jgi:hypothetical protein
MGGTDLDQVCLGGVPGGYERNHVVLADHQIVDVRGSVQADPRLHADKLRIRTRNMTLLIVGNSKARYSVTLQFLVASELNFHAHVLNCIYFQQEFSIRKPVET